MPQISPEELMAMLGAGGGQTPPPTPPSGPNMLQRVGLPELLMGMAGGGNQTAPPQPPQGQSGGVVNQAQQIQGQPGGMNDRIAQLLQMLGIDGSGQGGPKPPQVNPREQRMKMLQDFMSGTLFSLSEALQAHANAPVGSKNTAGIGAALGSGEKMRQRRSAETLQRDTLASQDRQRIAQAVSDVVRSQDLTDPTRAAQRLSSIEERMARAEQIRGPQSNLINAQAANQNAQAANNQALAQRNRYYFDNDKGLIDLEKPDAGYIKGTGSQDLVDITKEIADTFGLPAGLIGNSLTALDINRLTNAMGSPYRIVQDAEHVRVLNPVTGDMYEFGPPASTGRGNLANRQMWMMYETKPGPNGELITNPVFVQPGTGNVVRAGNLGIADGSLSAPAIINPQLVAASKQVQEGAKAANFLKIIDDLSAKINIYEGVEAIAKGGIAKTAAQFNMNADLVNYDSAIEAFTPMWARNVGHTGVLTQQDVDSVKAIFPKVTDSKQIRDQKMETVKAILNGNLDSAMKLIQQYGGTPTGKVLTRIFYDKDREGDGQGILSQMRQGRVLGAPGMQTGPSTPNANVDRTVGQLPPVPQRQPAPAQPAAPTRQPLTGRGGTIRRVGPAQQPPRK